MSKAFRLEGAKTILESFIFDVETRTVSHAEGEFTRDVVVHPGAVAVLCVDEQDRVGFIRQYRATFDDVSLEIPAGTCDVPGEELIDAAKRELLEEMGCQADFWRLLGRFKVSPGWSTQVMTIFEARELHHVGRHPVGPEEMNSTIEWIPRGQLKEVLQAEGLIDSTVAIAMNALFGSFFSL